MSNAYAFTAQELQKLHDDLKAYEARLADYLVSHEGKKDPCYSDLLDTDLELNVIIYNLSGMQLKLEGDNAGNAVATINSAVDNLKATIARKDHVENDLAIAQAALVFVNAILSAQPSEILSAGGAFVSKLKAA